MSGAASHDFDWGAQQAGLEALLEAREPRSAHETWFGYAEPGPEKFVRWAPSAREHRVCVAVLRRYGKRDKPAVLVLPGATAWRGTFFQPDGGLIGKLHDDFDVWSLDWRGTKVITDIWRDVAPARVPPAIKEMTLYAIADGEVAAAVERVCEQRGGSPGSLAILGHCVGGALVALSIARNRMPQLRASNGGPRPKAILSTLGLFYRGAVDTWLRANERADQERDGDAWYIDFAVDAEEARPAWPASYETVYRVWTRTPYPHCELSFCRRMSSIVGAPYRPDEIGYLHDDERNGLRAQFGVLPLSLLGDIARAVRRGMIDVDGGASTCAARKRFCDFQLTLLTGSENQLWHRDSIDRMHEWLVRERGIDVEKRIFERYGHQDLWWSPRAAEPGGVYDYVVSRLRATVR